MTTLEQRIELLEDQRSGRQQVDVIIANGEDDAACDAARDEYYARTPPTLRARLLIIIRKFTTWASSGETA